MSLLKHVTKGLMEMMGVKKRKDNTDREKHSPYI
jgi:hypothetical protein